MRNYLKFGAKCAHHHAVFYVKFACFDENRGGICGRNKRRIMNQYKVLAFGITRQLLGGKEAMIEVDGNTVGALRQALSLRFPELNGLNSLYIAVNSGYSEEGQVLSPEDEIALIPPVSGG